MDFLSTKWMWMYTGAALMLLEIMAPGFVIFFFGLAAATVGLLLFVTDLSLTAQTVLFTVLSIAYIVGLRRLMKSLFMGEKAPINSIEREYVGRIGKVVEEIRPGIDGRIMLGDAEWSADAKEKIEVGREVRVTAQRNLTMIVEKV